MVSAGNSGNLGKLGLKDYELYVLSTLMAIITDSFLKDKIPESALLAAICADGIPMAWLVMIAVVLKAVRSSRIYRYVTYGRILHMFRTTKCIRDNCCAVIIAKSEGEILKI